MADLTGVLQACIALGMCIYFYRYDYCLYLDVFKQAVCFIFITDKPSRDAALQWLEMAQENSPVCSFAFNKTYAYAPQFFLLYEYTIVYKLINLFIM